MESFEMQSLVRIVCLFVFVSVMGCQSTVQSGGLTVYKDYWEQTDRDLRDRAAMALGCMPEQVELILVERQARYPSRVLAKGCGHEALYSRHYRRSAGMVSLRNSSWVLESSSFRRQARTHTSAL